MGALFPALAGFKHLKLKILQGMMGRIVKKLKIYLDTSVISAHFDFKKPVRQLITQKWFEDEIVRYESFISDTVLQEIGNT